MIKFDVHGDVFIYHPDQVASDVYEMAKKDFYKFSETLSKFEHIGDFRADQLVYSAQNREWILLDFKDEHYRVSKLDALLSPPRLNPLEQFLKLPMPPESKEFLTEVRAHIQETRAAGTLFSKCNLTFSQVIKSIAKITQP